MAKYTADTVFEPIAEENGSWSIHIVAVDLKYYPGNPNHNFISIRENGEEKYAFHGMALDRETGGSTATGNNSDTIRIYPLVEDDNFKLFLKGDSDNPMNVQAEQMVFSGDETQIRRKIAMLLDTANFINTQNLVYDKFELFGTAQNSNSAAHSLIIGAGLKFPAEMAELWAPGHNRVLLPLPPEGQEEWRSIYGDKTLFSDAGIDDFLQSPAINNIEISTLTETVKDSKQPELEGDSYFFDRQAPFAPYIPLQVTTSPIDSFEAAIYDISEIRPVFIDPKKFKGSEDDIQTVQKMLEIQQPGLTKDLSTEDLKFLVDSSIKHGPFAMRLVHEGLDLCLINKPSEHLDEKHEIAALLSDLTQFALPEIPGTDDIWTSAIGTHEGEHCNQPILIDIPTITRYRELEDSNPPKHVTMARELGADEKTLEWLKKHGHNDAAQHWIDYLALDALDGKNPGDAVGIFLSGKATGPITEEHVIAAQSFKGSILSAIALELGTEYGDLSSIDHEKLSDTLEALLERGTFDQDPNSKEINEIVYGNPYIKLYIEHFVEGYKRLYKIDTPEPQKGEPVSFIVPQPRHGTPVIDIAAKTGSIGNTTLSGLYNDTTNPAEDQIIIADARIDPETILQENILSGTIEETGHAANNDTYTHKSFGRT